MRKRDTHRSRRDRRRRAFRPADLQRITIDLSAEEIFGDLEPNWALADDESALAAGSREAA